MRESFQTLKEHERAIPKLGFHLTKDKIAGKDPGNPCKRKL
jgi:hypothetical protein